MLTEFFTTNSMDKEARRLNLLYKEFHKFYVWEYKLRTWTPRKKWISIGRLYTVNPMENERYYLRVLLNNVRSPTSFDNLLTVHGICCNSFQEAAHERGLLHNDDDIEQTLQEASVFKLPVELRRLLVTLLHHCKPANPTLLFNKFYDFMAEDIVGIKEHIHLTNDDILHKVLEGINDTLESLGRDVNEFNLVSFKFISSQFQRLAREIASERNIPIPEDHLRGIHKLNSQQNVAFDMIYNAVMSNDSGVFFIDGPGGTGKSFLYTVLLAHIRLKGYIGLIVSLSGIASSNFLGGQTTHSRFKIPIDGG
ncbi:hypothetical protein LIER_36242 [Lithospermum erythrorhizon]|uniref:ATP-dependent DNA helicase n=1 Tax=Lithospermum erythrorhizon TaxID=34254 RepID=A0AAV3P4N7_LITER